MTKIIKIMTKKNFILAGSVSIALSLSSCKPEIEADSNSPASQSTQVGGTTIHKLMINNNPTYVNETNGKYFYADDLTITENQFNYLKKLAATGVSTTERSTIAKSFVRTWPNGVIYYRIPDQGDLSNQDYVLFKRNLDIAFNMISSGTNIEFVERTNQTEYLNFQAAPLEIGNNSPLGWTSGQANTINLYNYDWPGIIAHEIMHSMGIMHEQCRPDRDQYMIVNTDRADQGTLINFNIDPLMAGFGNLDFNSVMMYSSDDFAINPALPVMTRLDGSTFTGQREAPSEGDYVGINHLYGPVNDANNGIYNIGSALENNMNLTSQVDPVNQDVTNVVLAAGAADNNQRFVLRKSPDHGYYTIRSVADATKALTISNYADGSAVTLKRNTEGNDQKWMLINLGNDGYAFAPKNENVNEEPRFRLEVRVGNAAERTALIINADASDATTGVVPPRQRFRLSRVN